MLGKRLKVRDSMARVFSLDNEEYTVKVHWAPYFIPSATIAKALEDTGCKVEYYEYEVAKCKGLLSGCKTLTRSFTVSGTDKENIPHLLEVRSLDTAFEVLCTVAGRKPMCLRCKQVGHIRGQCTAAWCAACGNFGHTAEKCPSEIKSFANVVKKTQLQLANDSAGLTTVRTVRSHRARKYGGPEKKLGVLLEVVIYVFSSCK